MYINKNEYDLSGEKGILSLIHMELLKIEKEYSRLVCVMIFSHITILQPLSR